MYFGIVYYWCFIKDEKKEEPWYERNNCNKIISTFLGVLCAIFATMACMISPLTYVMGLAMQILFDGHISSYTYWNNILMGLVGFLLLSGFILALVTGFAILSFILFSIVECIDYCRKCSDEYDNLEETSV